MKSLKSIILVLVLVQFSGVFAQEEKEAVIKQKAVEFTDFLYAKMSGLDKDDRDIFEEASYDYITDVIKLMEKEPDHRSAKFQHNMNYLGDALAADLRPSMNFRANGGKNSAGTKRVIKLKAYELIKELDVEIPKWATKKKAKKSKRN